MQQILTETNNKLLIQTDLVFNLKNQITNFERIISNKDNQSDLSRDLNKRLQFDLKKQKAKNKLTMGAGIIGIAAAILLVK